LRNYAKNATLFSFVYNTIAPIAPIWPERLCELLLDARVHRQKSERLALGKKAVVPSVTLCVMHKEILGHVK
jgi:hypothetical protein